MATRESEKQLMKELEQAALDLDKAKQNAVEAKAIYDVEVAKLTKAQRVADSLADAIAAVRMSGDRRSITDEARNNAKKEKPVA
jgi:hypothetical protein